MDQRIVPARGEPHAGGGHPAWMRVALAEQGVRRCGRGESNPRIVEYNGCTNLVGYDDKVSWCSSFVNWCFSRVGIAGTGSALARSWLEWGRPLSEPAYGCVAVLMRDRPTSWKGHVGFYLRHDDERVYLFGGNQRGAVREYAYARSRLLSYRWPDERGLS
ncbi:NlpC/P60 family protein [Burkholderia pseudomallei]|uniref:NlpC/P60 family protein n=1 Tax=Burkholderia pseudomallei TaxID=28450 RepID=UPI000572867F|nr:TIGR02594 family protein [Burkholderia pseudomallei]